jgi:hypothetical protein
MKKKTEIFQWSALVFWITLGFILFSLLPSVDNIFYDKNNALIWIKKLKQNNLVDDSTFVQKDTLRELTKNIHVIWTWKDYQGSNHEIDFFVNLADSSKAAEYRKTYQHTNLPQLYYDFINISAGALDSMYNAMVKDIRLKGLVGQQVLDYVVTAIQTPNYTKISDSEECPCRDMDRFWEADCRPRKDGKGCCNGIRPIGVFTPTEFIVKKTGDCDTKSLIAYALLKKMGYKSALMVGRTGGYHAMLGLSDVNPVIPSRIVRHNGRIYYPWETTSFYDYSRLGNMNMWPIWEDWEVVCD